MRHSYKDMFTIVSAPDRRHGKNSMKHVFVFGAIVTLFSGCPSVPQSVSGPAIREVEGGIAEHSASGMRFPLSMSGFKRVGVRQYDTAGLNVGAGYNSSDPSAPIAITVYVYPSPSLRTIGSPASVVSEAKATLTRSEFQRAKAEIIQVHSDARPAGDQEVSAPRSAVHDAGHFGRFTYSDNFAGAIRPVESLLYVYCYVGETWTVKYRITYPANSLGGRAVTNQFIQDLTWTIKRPNKAPEPTPPSVMPRADARVTPATVVTHL
jgi:hypothetical protein